MLIGPELLAAWGCAALFFSGGAALVATATWARERLYHPQSKEESAC